MKLEDHPTVKRLETSARQKTGVTGPAAREMDAAKVRELALECGADDAGLVEIARLGLDPQRDEILRNYPWTHGRVDCATPADSRVSRSVRLGCVMSIAQDRDLGSTGGSSRAAAQQAGYCVSSIIRRFSAISSFCACLSPLTSDTLRIVKLVADHFSLGTSALGPICDGPVTGGLRGSGVDTRR